jgi:hypothetical protein
MRPQGAKKLRQGLEGGVALGRTRSTGQRPSEKRIAAYLAEFGMCQKCCQPMIGPSPNCPSGSHDPRGRVTR